MLDRYAERHPDWPVHLAEPPDGPWVKALAVMPAVARSTADSIVFADADVWTDGLAAAAAEVEAGAAWAMPHELLYRLSEAGTAAVLAGEPWERQELAEPVYPGVWGGGSVVIRRELLLQVPLDPRFEGWGQEDNSHAIALHCLLGPGWRGTAPMVHLWHPPQPRLTRKRGSDAGWRLYRRYCHAINDPAAMRELVTEAIDALPAPEPAVHDRPPLGVLGD